VQNDTTIRINRSIERKYKRIYQQRTYDDHREKPAPRAEWVMLAERTAFLQQNNITGNL